MSETPPLDITSFTTARERMYLLAYMATVKKHDRRGNNRIFIAQAITDSVPLDREWMTSARTSDPSSPLAQDRHVVRVRILGEYVDNVAPHSFLPDACNESTAEDLEGATAAVIQHTLALTARNYTGYENGSKNILTGDILRLSCRTNRRGQTNTERGTILETLARPSDYSDPSLSEYSDCSSLASLDWSGTTAHAGARAGSTTPAVSNYPECVSGTKSWTSVSTTALARVIKANTTNRSIGISILAMAITEQPIGRTNVGGFNYNHWGIMADVGSGWGAAGRSYIACAVSSTEGAGGTGDRGARIRWFAAFASDADAVNFMIAVIGGRSDVDEAGNTISFATVTDGITWAKLHTLQWLSPSDKRDRIKDSTRMALKGRNWDTAMAVYDAI
jgi:hypothetical protein